MPIRTPQRLDPLGTYSVWLLPPIAGVVAIAYAVASTLWHSDQIVHAPLAALGLVLVVLACVAFAWGSLPRCSPLSRTVFIAVLVLVVLGSLSFTAATWGHNLLVQDDWGQVVGGVLLLAMSQLRPPRELVIGGIAVAVALGMVAAVQTGLWSVVVSPIVYGVVAATPPIALALGAAVYARLMLRAIERWQRRARADMQALEPQVHESVARSVQQEFVTVLNRDAAPLLERILASGEITAADSDAAAAVASQLRVHAVDAFQSSWLADSVRRAGISDADAAVAADTDHRALASVTPDQRAVFGALLMALTHSPDWTVLSASVTVSGAPASAPASASASAGRLRPSRDAATRPSSAGRGGRLRPSRDPATRPASAGRGAARGTSAASRDPATRPADPAHEPQLARLTLAARIQPDAPRGRIRRSLMPYLSVLRVTSHDARLRIDSDRIEVGFSYDLA